MRLGLIVYGDIGTVSGGYLYDRMLVDHLRRQGDSVEVVSLREGSYVGHLAHNISPGLLRILQSRAWDLMLQDELNHPSLFLLNRSFRKGRSCPIISIVHHLKCSEHQAAWRNTLVRGIETRYLQSADGFIFVSAHTERCVKQLLGQGIDCITAHPGRDRLPGGPDTRLVEERARRNGPLKLVFVGNVIVRKGLHQLLRALALIEKTAWQLEVIGSLERDPAYVTSVMRFAEELRIRDRVFFRGMLGDTALSETLRTSHVLAVPSFHEGMGIVYMEAMGFGLPVIAARSGGAAEVVGDGREGFLVNPDETVDIAWHIRRMARDRKYLALLSRNALKRFGTLPTWDASGSQIRGFLRGFARTRQGTRPAMT